MESVESRVKILFLLDQEDGYPPIARESVWARSSSENRYLIDNIPFFVRGISPDDEVEVDFISGEAFFRRLYRPSQVSTFRLFLFDPVNDRTRIREQLKKLKCESEYNQHIGLLAVAIPANIAIQPFLDYAFNQKENGVLDVEEGALRHSISN
jgi:hypothetical protein